MRYFYNVGKYLFSNIPTYWLESIYCLRFLFESHLEDGRTRQGANTLDHDVKDAFDYRNVSCNEHAGGNGWIDVSSTYMTYPLK